jgi:hypothetical protein
MEFDSYIQRNLNDKTENSLQMESRKICDLVFITLIK